MPPNSIADIAAPACAPSASVGSAPDSAALTHRADRPGNRLLDMVEHTARIGSWSIDLPVRRLRHSKEFEAILGVAAGALMTLEDMVARYTPDWRASISVLMQNCSQAGIPFDEEMEIAAPARTRK